VRPRRQLRALIASQAQWKSAEARDALAARAAASGEGELAQALRRRDTSQLRKRHMLYLAYAWGVRSDLWRRKQRAGAAPTQASGAAAASAPPQPLLLLPPPAAPAREAALTRDLHLRGCVTAEMPRLRARATSLTSGGEAMRAIAATNAFALVTPFALDEWRGVLAVNQSLMAACSGALSALAVLRSDPDAYDGAAPAWMALRGALTPTEALLERVRAVYAIGVRLIETRSAARWRNRLPTAVERVYFEEPLASAHASLEHVARGSAALAALRLGRAEEYVAAAQAVAQEVSDSLHAQDAAARQRLRWLAEFAAVRDTEAAQAATARVAPANFPALEAEAAKAMPLDWGRLAAQMAT
jgi:hypothetical protein